MTSEASPAAPLKAPRRRWLQFSLRTLASVITWFGSGNGAKIAQGHCVLERVGD